MNDISKKYNVLIIEDHIVFAQGFTALLQNNDCIGEVYHTQNPETTIAILEKQDINIVFLDINFNRKEFNGISIAHLIHNSVPITKIIILSSMIKVPIYEKLFKTGIVDGYLDKASEIEEIYNAIDMVIHGGKYISPDILCFVETENYIRTTNKESEILTLLEKGKGQKQVANELKISRNTVRNHLKNMYDRFDVNNIAELIYVLTKRKFEDKELK